jgi:nucleotide-binding universal stress UspA family protein
MTTTVYVPLDGSDRAEAALAPGAALAARAGAELVLLAARWPKAEDHTVQSYLDAQAARSPIPARPWILRDRQPAEAIVLACESDGALLCMATHGRGGLREAAVGSVAEAVIRRSVAPIVLVGPNFEPTWRLPDSPTILVGYDGSGPAHDVVEVAGRLSAELGGRVRLEQVLRPTDVVQTARFPAGDVEALEALVAHLEARGISAQYEIADGFDPADVLVADAEHDPVGLLGLASHGRTGLDRVVFGSVTMRAVRRARCPVLTTGPLVRVPE